MKERRTGRICLKPRHHLITYAICHLIGNVVWMHSWLLFSCFLLVPNRILSFLFNFRYEASYIDKLPEFLQGQEFLEKYVNHEDSVTIIDRKHIYAVSAPTRHPVYENFRVKVRFYNTYLQVILYNVFLASTDCYLQTFSKMNTLTAYVTEVLWRWNEYYLF